MKPLKRGVLSNAEKAYIQDNFRTKSPEEMASELNRSPKIISEFVVEQGGTVPNGSVLTALRSRPEWETLRLEFTDEELKTFEHYYIKFAGQFGGDEGMLPTEEMQVFDLIKSILNTTRIQRELRKFNDEMHDIEVQLAAMKAAAAGGSPAEKRAAAALRGDIEARYAELSRNQKDVYNRYNSQEARRSQILKDLKGTRDQRVKMIEDGKQSFTGLIRLLMEEDFRSREEAQMKMAAAAAVKEKARLSRPHKYADGVVDQPILTAGTLLDDYEEAATCETAET